MAEQMLSRMFDEVTRARYLDRVEDLQRYDFVIQLLHESFDDRNLYFLIGSRQSYRVGLGAAISRPDGPREAAVYGEGSESFWHMGLGEALPVEGKARLSTRAGQTLNKAVQESLFGLMERLAATAALADEVTLRAVSAFADGTTFSRNFQRFIDEINERGKGVIQVEYREIRAAGGQHGMVDTASVK